MRPKCQIKECHKNEEIEIELCRSHFFPSMKHVATMTVALRSRQLSP